MATNLVLWSIFVLCAVMQGTAALSCYECNAAKACNDDFDAGGTGIDTITQIPGTGVDCQYCLKVKIVSLGSQQTSRACVGGEILTYQTGCFTQKDQNSVETTMCYCDSESCNHSTSLSVPVSLMTVLSFVHASRLWLSS